MAILPGDRWRRFHGNLKNRSYLDGRALGIDIQSEVYGLFTHHHSDEGRTAYGNLSQREKRLQTIVPDLVTANHPEGSVLQNPGTSNARDQAHPVDPKLEPHYGDLNWTK